MRTAGIVNALTIIPMLMPPAWAQAAHTALGLGELPGKPIVIYLIRGMCALYGGLLLLLANDVHRYHRLIKFQAVATCRSILAARVTERSSRSFGPSPLRVRTDS